MTNSMANRRRPLRFRWLPFASLGFLWLLTACAQAPSPPAPSGPFIRFGIARFFATDPLNVLDRLKGWGFDYVEPSLSDVAKMSEDDFASLAARVRAAGTPVEAMNFFVPKEVRLTGPDADSARIRAYLEKSLARAERLGAKIVVFGSGGARAVPAGFPMERARAQLLDFVRACATEIDRRGYGITIAVEPLPPSVTNVLLTLDECAAFVDAADRPRIQTMFDFDNMAGANDDPDAILRAGTRIVHVHMANPARGRVYPRDPDEDSRYRRVVANLRTIGYRGRVSLEANSPDLPADAPAGLAVLRALTAGVTSSVDSVRQLNLRKK